MSKQIPISKLFFLIYLSFFQASSLLAQAPSNPKTEATQPANKIDSKPTEYDHLSVLQGLKPTIVNGIAVDQKEIEAQLKLLLMNTPNANQQLINAFKIRAVKPLIDRILIDEALIKVGLKVEVSELSQKVNALKAKFKTEALFVDFLKKSGDTVSSHERKLYNEIALHLLINHYQLIQITEDDIKLKYQQLKYRFVQPQRIKARHLMLAFSSENPTAEEVESKRIKIMEYHAKILQGESFQILASQYSDSPDKSRQGDLGYFARGELINELEDEAFKLKVGELSAPFKTKVGWHIIRVEDEQKAHTTELDKIRDYLSDLIKNEKLFPVKSKYLKELWQKAKIESDLTFKP